MDCNGLGQAFKRRGAGRELGASDEASSGGLTRADSGQASATSVRAQRAAPERREPLRPTRGQAGDSFSGGEMLHRAFTLRPHLFGKRDTWARLSLVSKSTRTELSRLSDEVWQDAYGLQLPHRPVPQQPSGWRTLVTDKQKREALILHSREHPGLPEHLVQKRQEAFTRQLPIKACLLLRNPRIGMEDTLMAVGHSLDLLAPEDATRYLRSALALRPLEFSYIFWTMGQGQSLRQCWEHLARAHRHGNVLDTILCDYPDLNLFQANPQGRNYMHAAALSEDFSMMRSLKEKNVPWSSCDNDGNTVLHSVVKAGKHEALALLRQFDDEAAPEHRLDWNQECRKGHSPLAFAAARGNLAVMAELLRCGADINRPGSTTRMTPLGCAALAGHLDSVEYLLSRGANADAGSGMSVAYQSPKIIETLLRHGADVNYPSPKGETLLCKLVTHGASAESVDTVIRQGADVQCLTAEGESLLIFLLKKIRDGLNQNPTWEVGDLAPNYLAVLRLLVEAWRPSRVDECISWLDWQGKGQLLIPYLKSWRDQA